MKPGLLFATALLCPGSVATAQSPQKNILFIGVDDLRVELGCYGAEHMKTPSLDTLARQGLLFEQAYCQQAVCAPTRSSLMTGMRPDSTGVFDLNHPLNKALPDALSIPRFFKQNGYRTVAIRCNVLPKTRLRRGFHWLVLSANPKYDCDGNDKTLGHIDA